MSPRPARFDEQEENTVKRVLLLLLGTVAALFAAGSATAASIVIDATTPGGSYGPVTTVTVTLMIGPAGETVPTLSAYGVKIGWDPAVARVLGSNGTTTFGKSSQSPIIAGLSGSPTPVCDSSGPNKGKACTVITQSNVGAPVNVPGGTVVIGTLNLEILGGDLPGTFLFLSIVAYTNNGITNPATDPNLTLTCSFRSSDLSCVPEPATAALMALGLVGLGVRGRRAR